MQEGVPTGNGKLINKHSFKGKCLLVLKGVLIGRRVLNQIIKELELTTWFEQILA